MGNRVRGGRKGLALAVLGGLGLILVGIAAVMPRSFPFRRGSERTGLVAPETSLVTDVLLVALIGILVVAAVMVQVSVRRGSYATPLSKRRPVWAQVIVVLVVLWSAALLGTLLEGDPEKAESGSSERERSSAPPPEPGLAAEGSRALGLVVTGGLLVLVVGSSALLFYLGRRDHGRLAEDRVTRTLLSGELAASSAAMASGSDARAAVIACYERLTEILGRAGVSQRPSDAPFELIERALRELHVPASSAERLTALFEIARFSERDVDEPMRAEAIAALDSVRAALDTS